MCVRAYVGGGAGSVREDGDKKDISHIARADSSTDIAYVASHGS